MKRATPIAAFLGLLLACGGAPRGASRGASTAQAPREREPEVPPTGRAPNLVERRALALLLRETASVRGLEPTRDIRSHVATAAEITTRLGEQLDPAEMITSQREYEALGLLPPGLDLRALVEELLGEQVVGFYDPERAELVLRDDAAADLGHLGAGAPNEGRVALVHELTHALQDQVLHLGAAMDLERDTDADNAFHSLVEGDATLTMIGWMLARAHRPLSALTRAPGGLSALDDVAPRGQQLTAAPRIVQVSLLAPYLRGLRFCAALHARGGFAAIDHAFARPPRSTEQVLHPQKYLADERPRELALPGLPGLEQRGWHALKEDTLGELELSVYLGLGTPDGVDETAAAGWGGDRLRVYQGPDGLAAVWWTSWDDEADAREAETAARRAQQTADPEARDAMRVLRIAEHVFILRGVPPAAQPSVVSALERAARDVGAAPSDLIGEWAPGRMR